MTQFTDDEDYSPRRLTVVERLRIWWYGKVIAFLQRHALYPPPIKQYLRPDGDDANDGLTYQTAKQTLGGAEKDLPPGSIIYVAPSRKQQ